MATIYCTRCGGVTNTAVSDHEFKMEGNTALRCYAKVVDGKWAEGCAYNDGDADLFLLQYAKKLIEG